MFFLFFRKRIRVWFVFGVVSLISLIVVATSLLPPEDLMKFSLSDISKGQELKVFSLIFHGFAISHTRFGVYDSYRSLVGKQDRVSLYYYRSRHQKHEGEEAKLVSLSLKEDFYPLAEGRFLVYQRLKNQGKIYAIPFSFDLTYETWDSVLFWDAGEEKYFLYSLVSSREKGEKVYLFYQNPLWSEEFDLAEDPFPFLWDRSSLDLGKSLVLSQEFFLVWPSIFKVVYMDLLELVRLQSDLN